MESYDPLIEYMRQLKTEIEDWRLFYGELLRLQAASNRPNEYNCLLQSTTQAANRVKTKLEGVLNGHY